MLQFKIAQESPYAEEGWRLHTRQRVEQNLAGANRSYNSGHLGPGVAAHRSHALCLLSTVPPGGDQTDKRASMQYNQQIEHLQS
jgi:hypothetical protein